MFANMHIASDVVRNLEEDGVALSCFCITLSCVARVPVFLGCY